MEMNPQIFSFSQASLQALSNFNTQVTSAPRKGGEVIPDEEEEGVRDACWKHQTVLYWLIDLLKA